MTLHRPLTLTITHQEESPHLVHGYLTVDGSWRLFPMTQAESKAVARVILAAGGRKGGVLVWSTSENSRFNPFLAEAHRFSVTQGDDESSETVRYAAYRETGDDLALAIRTVWNSYDYLDIVPADSGSSEAIAEVVEQCSTNASEARLGMDWQNRWYFRQNNGCLAILGSVWGTVGFILRLLFSERYKRELVDPFRQVERMAIVEKYGAVFGKEGHDESVGLGFLTSNRCIVEEIQRMFDAQGIPLVIAERSRESHWESSSEA